MNNAISRVFECFSSGDVSGVEALIDPRYITRNAAGAPESCLAPGPAGFVALVHWLRSAFDDLSFDVQETIGEGERTMVRVIMSGRHAGNLLGVPASGCQIAVAQVHIFRVVDGRLVEHRSIRDDLGLMRQIKCLDFIQPKLRDRRRRVNDVPSRLRLV